MIRLFLPRVLKWIANVDWKQFLLIASAVANASNIWQKNANMSPAESEAANASRFSHVSKFIALILPSLSGWKKNVIIELAVAWFNLKGK